MSYKGNPVDILIKSAKGEEQKQKPLFFFCQGSLPVPLILLYDLNKAFGTFPFNTDSICKDYHIAIVGKPYTPVIADTKKLEPDYAYRDSSGRFLKQYNDRNLLSYYAPRNLEVINYLQKQTWISTKRLVVVGHSEGATIAAKMASLSPKITHLIYSGGNPLGRMLTIITRERERETDSISFVENNFEYWEQAIAGRIDNSKEITEFSIPPPMTYMEKLNIPVLVTYGSKDIGSAPFIDYMRLEMIRKNKYNFTFKAYIGTEHNFFNLKQNGEIDYDRYNWDNVALDWLKWLRTY
jgi:dienelactone hydrolase